MTKLLYAATMSLDGYIAGPGGDMSWLTGVYDEVGSEIADRVMANTGALLVGNTSFRGDDPNRGTDQEGAFGGQYDGPVVVLTHHVPDDPEPGVRFSSELEAAIRLATSAAGDAEYVNIIGADVARQCLEAGELNEILIFIAPVLLGGGTRAFSNIGSRDIRLIPREDAAAHWYRVDYG